jgi:CIC family chloride channel protein
LLENYKKNEFVLLLFLGATMLLKSFATGLTLGSGGNGGNFAPSLFVGSYLGYVVARLVNMTGIDHQLPVGNFTVVGMAGILSGLFHAPLTAIFLIGEITGGYDLMIPLMIVSSISFAVSKQFENYSMDTKHLAKSGEVFTSDKDKNILLNIDILMLIRTGERTLKLSDSMENLLSVLAETTQKDIAVIDDKNNLIGTIDLDAIRPIIFNAFRVKFTKLNEIIVPPKGIINYEEGLDVIMEKFESTHAEALPVLKNGKFEGYIYKIDILLAYRQMLKEMVID